MKEHGRHQRAVMWKRKMAALVFLIMLGGMFFAASRLEGHKATYAADSLLGNEIDVSTIRRRIPHLNKALEDPIWMPRNRRTFTDSEVADMIMAMAKNGNFGNSAKYAVDLGANDGSGPSEKLFKDLLYPGLLIEGDNQHLPSLQERFPSSKVKTIISFITPSTITGLLEDAEVPRDMHYLKIDMDADDCSTLVAVLEAGYRPRVLQAEVTYEIPYPYAFALYPLSKYGYEAHYGFQSCSLTMLHFLLRRYGYKLISVGGTKDAIYVHEKSMAQLLELDMVTALNTFWDCCVASANPSNSKQLELEPQDPDLNPGLIPPSQWFPASFVQYKFRNLMVSIRAYLNAACLRRASNVGESVSGGRCPFDFILSDDPEEAADEFIRKNVELLTHGS